MFYIKTKLASGKVGKTDITDENVFTYCPACGRELPVDLVELFSDGEGDLFSTSIFCAACTKKRVKKNNQINGTKITADGLALLSVTLCQAGLGEQVYSLLDRFQVESIHELTPEQYRLFANALSDVAMSSQFHGC